MFFSYKNGQARAISVKAHFDAPSDPIFRNIGILKFHGLQLLNCLYVELLSNTVLFFLSFFIKDLNFTTPLTPISPTRPLLSPLFNFIL